MLRNNMLTFDKLLAKKVPIQFSHFILLTISGLAGKFGKILKIF